MGTAGRDHIRTNFSSEVTARAVDQLYVEVVGLHGDDSGAITRSSPTWVSPLASTPGEFESHCAWLARRRTLLPLDVAVDRLDPSGRLPRTDAAVTLDDGFEPIHEHAFPVIKRYGVPTTVFVVAQTLTAEGQDVDWVRTPPPWPLRTLNLEQILEMQDAGVDFQSHSWAHHDLHISTQTPVSLTCAAAASCLKTC